jgi:Carboxypeptidase regulatory-like domain
MNKKRTLHFLVLMLAIFSLRLNAQSSAEIVGSVKDQDGKPVANATVEADGQKTDFKRKLSTGADGTFTLAELPPDSYQISATCGVCNDVSSIVDISAGQTRSVELSLNTKSSSTEISVDKHATTMESSSARLGFNVTAPEIADLPVNGRTLGPLELTAPLVTNSGGAGLADLRFAGQSNQENHYRFDGVDASAIASAAPSLEPVAGAQFRLRTSVESIQEFRVDSAMYTAEDGFGTGGQIKLISKSGGNAPNSAPACSISSPSASTTHPPASRFRMAPPFWTRAARLSVAQAALFPRVPC